jgi:predicted RNA binding protein YcfA (HicA-like mRNA interferase family)
MVTRRALFLAMLVTVAVPVGSRKGWADDAHLTTVQIYRLQDGTEVAVLGEESLFKLTPDRIWIKVRKENWWQVSGGTMYRRIQSQLRTAKIVRTTSLARFGEEAPLARHYREVPVNAIWEGSGNVMALDVLRVLGRGPGDALEHRVGLVAQRRDPFLEELLRRRRARGLPDRLCAVARGVPRLLGDVVQDLVELAVVELEEELVQLLRLRRGARVKPLVFGYERRDRWGGLEGLLSDVLRILRARGWLEVKARGGHRQLKHPDRPGRVTVSGNLRDDMPPGTWNNVQKQAGLKDKG